MFLGKSCEYDIFEMLKMLSSGTTLYILWALETYHDLWGMVIHGIEAQDPNIYHKRSNSGQEDTDLITNRWVSARRTKL